MDHHLRPGPHLLGEQARLDALHRLGLLDTPADDRFDRLTQLAATLLDVPIALVSLVDRDRQWFKANVGLDARETSREVSFCSHAIELGRGSQLIVPDARSDSRFVDNPLVTSAPGIRFYAGQVIADEQGHALGTLCVIDRRPRQLEDRQRLALAQLGRLVEDEIAHRDRLTRLVGDHLDRQLNDAVIAHAPVGLAVLDRDRRVVRCNGVFALQAGREPAELIGLDLVELVHPDERTDADERTDRIRTERTALGAVDRRLVRPDGEEMVVDVRITPVDGPDGMMIVRSLDVTEQRRLHREVARYRYFFDNASDLIVVLDADANVVETSPSVRELLGVEGADPRLTARLLHHVHPDDAPSLEGFVRSLTARNGHESVLTIRVIDRTQRYRHIELTATDVLDVPALKGILLTGRDVTDRVRANERLAHTATHDALTGLPNRALFEDQLRHSLGRAQRGIGSVAVVYLDLDHFKSINDTLGHARGDDVLRAVANTLLSHIRPGDVAARMGGDEFVVILDPVLNEEHALMIGQRMCRAATDAVLDTIGGGAATSGTTHLLAGSSAGVACFQPGDTAASLCERADAELYRVKHERGSTRAAPSSDLAGELIGPRADRALASRISRAHPEHAARRT